jgi:MFS family permease
MIASGFIGFAVARIVASLIVGPMIDRFTARNLFPFYQVPLLLALTMPLIFPSGISVYLYLGFIGVGLGIGSPIKTALWAEMYGAEKIGAVRSLFAALMVFGTSLSPFIMGFILDSRAELPQVFGIAITTIVLSILLALVIYRRPAGKMI